MKYTTLFIIVIVVLAAGAAYVLLRSPAKSGQNDSVANNNTNTMPQELIVEDITNGSGDDVKTGDTVTVHYVGTLADGTQFDSSRDRKMPFSFTVGAGKVIAGWEQGLLGMKVGGVRKLVIPPHLAYGPAGVPGVIPQNATLTFEIELLNIKP